MSTFNRQAAFAYRNIGLETRATEQDQHQLVALMFETLLEALNAALGAMARQELPVKIKKINHALLILQDGLHASLDLKRGGELGQNLAALYDYCSVTLMQANLKNDTDKVQEVINLIKPVAEAWAQIRGQATGATSASTDLGAGRTPATMNSMFSFTVG